QHHGDAAEADRAQERLAVDEQARQAGGDGEPGEEHRASGGADGAAQRRFARVVAGAAARDLLAITADDEERVVDGHAEAEDGDDVDGEGVDGDDARGEAEQAQAVEDRQPADDDGQERGDDAAEDDDEQDARRRQGDALAARERAFGDAGERAPGGDQAAEARRDRRAARRSERQARRDARERGQLVLRRAVQADDDEGAAPVARDEAIAAEAGRAEHLRRRRIAGGARHGGRERRARLGRDAAARARQLRRQAIERDDVGIGVAEERARRLGGARRFGARIEEDGVAEPLRHSVRGEERRQRHDDAAGDHGAAPACDLACEAIEHDDDARARSVAGGGGGRTRNCVQDRRAARPQARAMLSAWARAERWVLRSLLRPLIARGDVASWRRRAIAQPAPFGVRVVPTRMGGVPAEWLLPADAGDTILYYLHGGGFVMGDPPLYRRM